MPLTDFKATTPQSKVVGNLFKGLATLDISNIEPFVSKDFKYRTFPKTDNLPDQSKAACLEKYGTVISLFTKMEFDAHEVIEAQEKVVAHVTAVCHTPDGDKIEYDSLSVFTVIEEDGELKVDEFKDFSDPEKRENLHGWVAEVLAKRATL